MCDIACYCRWGTPAELHVNPKLGREEAAAPTSDAPNDDLEHEGDDSDEDEEQVDEQGRKALNHIEASPASTSDFDDRVMIARRST